MSTTSVARSAKVEAGPPSYARPMSARHGDIADRTASRPFAQVDVFTDVPTRGNPVAVVLAGGGPTDEQMAAFARWTDLSEPTFLLPPTPHGAAGSPPYPLPPLTAWRTP